MAQIKKGQIYTTEISNSDGRKTGRYNTYTWIGRNVYRQSGTALRFKRTKKKTSGSSGG